MARNNFQHNYIKADDMRHTENLSGNENFQLNNDRMTIEQLISYIQDDLTFSGMMPKVLPDTEIMRIIKETALEWFYKNYQFAVMKFFYRLDQSFINSDEYSKLSYITLPEEIENITKISEMSNPSLFRLGIQSPNLAISQGVMNSPYLTSFVTSISELAVYKQVISAFSDEINKMSRQFTKFSFNPLNKRLNILDEVRTSYMLECYVRIQQEEVFNNNLFKTYATALCTIRMGQLLGRLTFNMPGSFNYNAESVISQGEAALEKVKEEIKSQSPNSCFFIMSR
jgi:hypothetical protein